MTLIYQDEWKKLSDSIQSFQLSVSFVISGSTSHDGDKDGSIDILITEADELKKEIEKFDQSFNQFLPQPAQNLLKAFLKYYKDYNKEHSSARTLTWKLAPKLIKLFSFNREFSRQLNNNQDRIRKTVEIAFAHLQRQLIADETVRQLWLSKTEKGGAKTETHFEQLGSNHLLYHKIWAFKVNAEGERTDLVLSESLAMTDPLYSSVDGLVLTEWKVVPSKDELDKKIEEAKYQTTRYARGSLGSLELSTHRYLIMVSEKNLFGKSDKDFTEGGVTYRVINLAYNPDNPSKEARNANKKQ